jgi:hypothetical protein
MSVYVVQHVHASEGNTEDTKFIGVYSSRDKAHAAVERLSRTPGFSDAPDGFCIDEYQLDKDQWAEGYVTLASA